MAKRGTRSTGEVVPLAERMRYLHLFRLTAAAAVVASVLATPTAWTAGRETILAAAGYALGSVLGLWLWSRSRRRNLPLFGAFLLVDGVFLATIVYANGGLASPFRYVILLHLVTVSLIASYRTGLKLAIWHSLLLMVVTEAQRVGLLIQAGAFIGDGMPAFIGAMWLVTVVVSGASAVNERELRRHRYDLESLARLAAALEHALDPRAVGEVAAGEIAATFDASRVAVVDARDGRLGVLARHGDVSRVGEGRGLADAPLVARTLSEHATVLARDPADADPWLGALLPGARHVILLPMLADDQAIGVIVVEMSAPSRERVERRVVATLERFASHTAMALQNAWLHASLTRSATTDGLTGLANRRSLDDRLVTELARSERTGEPLSLVLIDIDHFKQFNDTYGHLVGDEVLRGVAAVLAEGCRPFDLAGRFGGEEFVVLLPGIASQEGRRVADRLRAAVASAALPAPVTISAGVSCSPDGCTVPEILLGDADRALYEAKRGGRNRVCLAGDGKRAVGGGLSTSD